MKEHAIAYILVDRTAAGREPGYTPSCDDLPAFPEPAYPGMPERGVESDFSKEQLIEYRELAAEMDRQAYAHAHVEALNDDEETKAPRGGAHVSPLRKDEICIDLTKFLKSDFAKRILSKNQFSHPFTIFLTIDYFPDQFFMLRITDCFGGIFILSSPLSFRITISSIRTFINLVPPEVNASPNSNRSATLIVLDGFPEAYI